MNLSEPLDDERRDRCDDPRWHLEWCEVHERMYGWTCSEDRFCPDCEWEAVLARRAALTQGAA